MKKNYFAVILLSLSIWCGSAIAQPRSELLLEKNWRFTRADQADFSNIKYNDSKWQNVIVPHDWAIYGPFSANNDKQHVAIAQDGQKEASEHAGRTGRNRWRQSR